MKRTWNKQIHGDREQMGVPSSWRSRKQGVTAHRFGVTLRGQQTKMFWNLTEMRVVQLCECVKHHGMVPFEMVPFVLCELHCNF